MPQEPEQQKKQRHTVSVIREYETSEGKKTSFRECGIGWTNSDGSINFRMDLFPAVIFHMRKYEPQKERQRR